MIALYTLDNALQDQALKSPGGWVFVYIPPVIGFVVSTIMLWIAANPGLFRRRPPISPSESGEGAEA